MNVQNPKQHLTTEDWQFMFDERAAILEYDEGLPRLQAEALARQWLIAQRGSLNGIVTAKRQPPRLSAGKM